MYAGVQNCSKSYGLYVGQELEIFPNPTACDYSLTDVKIFTSPTAIYREERGIFSSPRAYIIIGGRARMFSKSLGQSDTSKWSQNSSKSLNIGGELGICASPRATLGKISQLQNLT